MKISILTIFPEMFEGFLTTSIIKKAILKELVEVEMIDIRSFTKDKHNRVDDYPFGGGAGLVMMAQPVIDAINSCKAENSHVIYMTPVGHSFKQRIAKKFAGKSHLILLCGHYEGIDERIMPYVDECISIGDYVLTGGELAAMVVSDAVIRLQPGVITEDSIIDESYEDNLLEYPQYTRPATYQGVDVPKVLLSGHHEEIRKWRLKQSLLRTKKFRPDLLEHRVFTKEERKLLDSADTDE